MKTLREIAKLAIVKYGIDSRESLPLSLQEELRSLEEMIEQSMTVNDYYELYRTGQRLDFDMSWNKGEWILTQRNFFGGFEYDNKTISRDQYQGKV